jgi:predicted kinase
MPMLHLICGLPGSGKTNLARKLEVEKRALRMCPDEWMDPLYGTMTQAELDSRRDPVERMQWILTEKLLKLGVDVILEWGFWGRQERANIRTKAAALGATVKLHYLNVSRAELSRRIAARNTNLPPGTFHVSQEQLDLWWGWFEVPTVEELESL